MPIFYEETRSSALPFPGEWVFSPYDFSEDLNAKERPDLITGVEVRYSGDNNIGDSLFVVSNKIEADIAISHFSKLDTHLISIADIFESHKFIGVPTQGLSHGQKHWIRKLESANIVATLSLYSFDILWIPNSEENAEEGDWKHGVVIARGNVVNDLPGSLGFSKEKIIDVLLDVVEARILSGNPEYPLKETYKNNNM